MPTAPAELGDLVPLGQSLMNMTWWGYVTDVDTPSGVWATLEAVGDEAFVTMDVIQGPRGFKGDNAPLVNIKWDIDVTEVGDLPPDGTGFAVNEGIWIGDLVYIWTGPITGWIPKRPGPAGPRGITPHFDISLQTLTWEDQLLGAVPQVYPGGTDENPSLLFDTPQGPPGPPGPTVIRNALDYTEPVDGPETGHVLTWNNTTGKYSPQDPTVLTPRFFSVPEGAFTNFSGVALRQQIMSFDMPPLPYDWIPLVIGHIRAFGLEIDTDPLQIGAEVRLADPTSGQLVARGFGNIATWTTFTPHFSTPSTTMDAVTPDGGIARVPANHTGDEGKLFMNLYNDGLFGIYNYNKAGSQLAVIAFPVA